MPNRVFIIADLHIGHANVLKFEPQDFYRGRIAEAVKFWNQYARALNAQRRERNWKRAKVLREVTPNADRNRRA